MLIANPVMGYGAAMAHSDEDPAASTQQFKAYMARDGHDDKGSDNRALKTFVILGAVALVILVVGAVALGLF